MLAPRLLRKTVAIGTGVAARISLVALTPFIATTQYDAAIESESIGLKARRYDFVYGNGQPPFARQMGQHAAHADNSSFLMSQADTYAAFATTDTIIATMR